VVGQVLVFGKAKTPNFIHLRTLHVQIPKHLVLIGKARFAHFPRELLDCVLGDASNPRGRANRAAFAKAANYRTALFMVELVHKGHYA
jgi:hypothetical protein